jgi:predicted amidophosphoribosyltransferase
LRRLLAGAFAVSQDQRDRIANRPVLLIDDVMTTGATLYEAARTLHRAGSGPVRGLVLARVLHYRHTGFLRLLTMRLGTHAGRIK